MKQIKITIFFLFACTVAALAWKEPANTGRANSINFRVDCQPGQSVADMDVNNVRARLNQSGSLFVADGNGRYIVPKVDPSTGAQEVSSIYSAAVWIGGLRNGNPFVAGVQSSLDQGETDWYPGPLDVFGEIDRVTCEAWDKHFVVQGTEISTFRRVFDEKEGLISQSDIPTGVLGWPAKGNPYFAEVHGFFLPANNEPLAGFFDRNFDGAYDPFDGDYPIIEIRDCNSEDPPIPDQMQFWIFNDNGNFHAESGGDAIRMEVQVQTFAFSTNDAINDMTFYRYKMINRAPLDIDSTYFANWADVDLGCSDDDYIGCDTTTSLAIAYNNDAVDGITGCDCPVGGSTTPSYCNEVPMLGIDYFRGPLTPTTFQTGVRVHKDSLDSGTDLIRISNCEPIPGDETHLSCDVEFEIELGMSSFVYHVRQGLTAAQQDPTVDAEYYNYLSGSWRDGTRITEGGTGFNPGSTDYTRYVFPSAPNDTRDGAWSMVNSSIPDIDPRILQASGPFVLEPGKINELIVGIVWVPDIPDYPAPSIQPLLEADVAAQGLFDNCFDILNGPEAPDMSIIELDQELILTLSNPACSNNFLEAYAEQDIFAPKVDSIPGATDYLFEGYLIYQLANENVGVSELEDSDKARLAYQVDVTNGVSSIYNWATIEHPNPDNPPVYVPELQVAGENSGTRHSFQVTEDLFASGEGSSLINHKKYYYMALSYAYNNYKEFDVSDGLGQGSSYLSGRQSSCGREIQTYVGIPRPIIDLELGAGYGDGAIITRLEGQGAGGNFLRVEPTQIPSILDGTNGGRIEYLPGAAPITVDVFNPLVVKDGKYLLKILDDDLTDTDLITGRWELFNAVNPNDPIATSAFPLEQFNEQLLADLGISIAIGQTNDAGDRVLVNGQLRDKKGDDNGLLGIELEYTTENDAEWFASYRDQYSPLGIPGLSQFWNYIQTDVGEGDEPLDADNTSFSTFGSGLFYPYSVVSVSNSNTYMGPGWQRNGTQIRNANPIEDLNNVNIVMTSDKSMWSRCVVLETAGSFHRTSTFGINPDESQFEVSSNPSVGKNDNDGDGLADEDGEGMIGMSWFPGYAIDVETGERLNIFFGENSMYDPNKFVGFPEEVVRDLTGDDLMLNPTTSDLLQLPNVQDPAVLVSGGGHMIYVTDEKYDSCNVIWDDIVNGGGRAHREAIAKIKWTSFMRTTRAMNPLNGNDEPGLIPEDIIIRLRCDNQYSHTAVSAGQFFGYPTYEFELKGFESTAKEYAGETSILDNIMAVPNPYYGFSDYETGVLDKRIKITNLPDKATVTIYSLDGKFIRQYDRNEQPRAIQDDTAPLLSKQVVPDLEWDLENHAGIPIASGVYLIHIEAPGIGERIVKWFGVQREFDPSGL